VSSTLVNVNPGFVGIDDAHIAPASVLVGAGVSAAAAGGTTMSAGDIDGECRPFAAPDIGADQAL
jgi:hypothetical protein